MFVVAMVDSMIGVHIVVEEIADILDIVNIDIEDIDIVDIDIVDIGIEDIGIEDIDIEDIDIDNRVLVLFDIVRSQTRQMQDVIKVSSAIKK